MMAGLVVGLLTACATSGPRIAVSASPGVIFSSFATYNFMQPLSTDRPNGVRTPLSSMLINSMSREMASRGLEQSDTPDLQVNFFVNTEDRLDVRTVPTAGGFHAYRRGRYSTWGSYRTVVREYTRGTLSIDLVDASSNMLVWEGVAQDRLRSDLREITQEQVDQVVGQLMAKFMDRPK